MSRRGSMMKGKANTSFAPDSAETISRISPEMFFSASLPVTIVLDTTGSVGVTIAPASSAVRMVAPGRKAMTRLALIHMAGITMPSRRASDFHSRRM
jgi:hypothetical protein